MIPTLTTAETVGLVALYVTLVVALCKLVAYFDDQYHRAVDRQEGLSKSLSKLVAALDAKLRAKLARGSQIIGTQVIVEGRFSELRDREYAFLPEKEYRGVLREMLPKLAAYARAEELARWLPSGYRWLWAFGIMELIGMIVILVAVIYEVYTKNQCPGVYPYCPIGQGTLFIIGFVLYVHLKTKGQRLHAVERDAEAENERA